MRLSRGSLIVIAIALLILVAGVIQVIARGIHDYRMDASCYSAHDENEMSCPAGTNTPAGHLDSVCPTRCPLEECPYKQEPK